jgi:hypothetical protein
MFSFDLEWIVSDISFSDPELTYIFGGGGVFRLMSFVWTFFFVPETSG